MFPLKSKISQAVLYNMLRNRVYMGLECNRSPHILFFPFLMSPSSFCSNIYSGTATVKQKFPKCLQWNV